MKNTSIASSSRFPFMVVALSAICATVQATTYYWNGTGAIATVASWGTNTDGTGTAPTNFTTAGNTFEIQSGQNANLATAWTISGAGSNLIVDTGATFNSNFTAGPTLTLNLQSGANYNVVGSTTWSGLTFGTINSGSTFKVSSGATTLIDRTYGNLVWQSSGGNTTPSNNLTTTGSFTINSGAQLRTATGTTARTWTIGDSLNVSAGSTWVLTNVTDGNAATSTINIAGGLTNSGTIQKNTLNTTTAVNFNGTGSSNVQWGTIVNTNFAGVTFTVGSSKTIAFTDSLNEGAAAFAVNGTLNLGSQVLSGTGGTFTLASGATLITSNATGLDGAITVTGAKTFSTGANYEFRGAGTGTLLPSSVASLTINRSSGDVTLDGGSATQTVTGALSVLSGNLATGVTTNTVTAGSLNMRNSQINSGVTTNLGGNVTFDAANNGTATIAGNLGLGGTSRTFNIANGSALIDMAVSGIISDGGVVKSGLGTLAFSNDNSYLGATSVTAGTLVINGNQSVASGAVTVSNAGTTLSGSGTVGGATTIQAGAIHSSGDGIGKQTFSSSLNYDSSSSIFAWELGSETESGRGTSFDAVDVGTTLSVTDSIFKVIVSGLDITSTFWDSARSWDVFNQASTGTFAAFELYNASDLVNQVTYDTQGSFAFDTATGDLKWSAVPEPTSALAGLLLGAGLLRRRRVA